jgi:mono/diheme cytochrome c family protein
MIADKRFVACAVIVGVLFLGCGNGPAKTNAELGLNQQQAEGRAVFDHFCSACHNAYSSGGKKGPGLKALYRKEFLPSGLPANDRFVRQTIGGGRGMMPSFGGTLSPEQMDALIAYLHTL